MERICKKYQLKCMPKRVFWGRLFAAALRYYKLVQFAVKILRINNYLLLFICSLQYPYRNVILTTMSQKAAYISLKKQQTPSLKLPKAILSTELRQQATGNRQQATGNRQQATGNRQQATGNRQIIHTI